MHYASHLAGRAFSKSYVGYVHAPAAEIFIDKLKKSEKEVDIPATLPQIRQEDLDGLVNYAYREAYPLYPVPVLWDREQLKKIYYKVMDV